MPRTVFRFDLLEFKYT